MKNKLILLGLVLAIVGLVITQIYNNGAEHIDVVDTAVTLEKENDKLIEEKEVLESNVSALQQDMMKPEATAPSIIIEEKIVKMKVLVHDTIIVHDTIFIKEQKNFWGRTKSDTLQ